MRWRLRVPILLLALVATPMLAGCIDVPAQSLASAGAGGRVEQVDVLETSVRLDAVSGMERSVDVDVPEGARTVRVEVTIDGVANRLTWKGPGERCAGHAGLYVSQQAQTSSDCDAPDAGTHPLTFRLRDGAATLHVRVIATLPQA